VGHGGAARALDRGWEAAEAAVDGKPGLRRGSGEVGCSGKGKAVEMQAREKQEWVSGELQDMLKGPEEGTTMREQLLATGGRRGGSGGGGTTWRSEQRASAGWGAAVRVLGRHVA
jgi:hypothetical protein